MLVDENDNMTAILNNVFSIFRLNLSEKDVFLPWGVKKENILANLDPTDMLCILLNHKWNPK